MADQSEKLWLQASLNRIAVRRAGEQIRQQGRGLPCSVVAVSGSIVTVKFEVDAAPITLHNVTIPKAESQWIRTPIQVGDVGMTMAADAYLGGISGLGGGVAKLTQRMNLTALVFVPVAATSFPAADTNSALVCGPNGAVIQTEDGMSSVVVSPSGITLQFGGKIVTLNAAGLTIDGILFDAHVHGGVTSGGSETSVPVG